MLKLFLLYVSFYQVWFLFKLTILFLFVCLFVSDHMQWFNFRICYGFFNGLIWISLLIGDLVFILYIYIYVLYIVLVLVKKIVRSAFESWNRYYEVCLSSALVTLCFFLVSVFYLLDQSDIVIHFIIIFLICNLHVDLVFLFLFFTITRRCFLFIQFLISDIFSL